MIIGNSYSASEMFYYSNRETGETVVLDGHFNQDECSYFFDNPEKFLFLRREVVPWIEDDWSSAEEFDSERVNLIIECDYCGNHFKSNWKTRRRKATNYLGYFFDRDGVRSVNDHNIDLYKDNCKHCEIEKTRESTMINNGYWHPSETEEHKERVLGGLAKHNSVPTSRGQRYIARMLGADLNVRVGDFFANIVLDDKIIIEYDGGGHNLGVLLGDLTQKEFDTREKSRSEFLISKGYKIVRFISPSELFPEDECTTREILMEAVSELYLSNLSEIHIVLSSVVNDPNYGKLKPIKNILESSKWGEDKP